jgi:hypothetical protein
VPRQDARVLAAQVARLEEGAGGVEADAGDLARGARPIGHVRSLALLS